LRRDLRGALVGHLAYSEMTSVVGMARYVAGVERLTNDARAAEFFAVHVEADEGHGRIALNSLVGGLVRDAPELVADVLFGVRCMTGLGMRMAGPILEAWTQGASSLVEGQ
jgi:Iron-containing redox enzyme